MSARREFALTTLLPNFEISRLERPVDLRKVLKTYRVIVDFGSGMGLHTLNLATNNPNIGVLAIDVHTVGLLAVAEAASDSNLLNIRTHHGDGMDVLKDWLVAQTLDEVHILFPDPWPKARHHKRRLINQSFLQMVWKSLVPGGRIIFVTDDETYFASASEDFKASKMFDIDYGNWDVPLTTYHQRAKRLNHKVSQLSATKI